MLSVYVFSNGDICQSVITAITNFMNHYESILISMVAAVAIPVTGAQWVKHQSPQILASWAFITGFLPMMALTSTHDVEIIDASNPMQVYSVTEVPDILAVPAWLTTSNMYAITSAVESIFHTDDDSSYARTGMVFGASLYEAAFNNSKISGDLQEDWNQYVSNCLRPDMTINAKFTWEQLRKTTDLIGFLQSHNPSPLREIVYSDADGKKSYVTCKVAISDAYIPSFFKNEYSNTVLDAIADALWGNSTDQLKSSTKIQSAMTTFNSDVMDVSSDSTAMVQQIMALNALKQGATDDLSKVNGMMNYAEASTEAQSLGMMTAAGLWAQKKIPLLQTILTMLIMCGGIIALPLAMLPGNTHRMLMNYVKGYGYLCTWPVCFVFVNYICKLYLGHVMQGVSSAGGINLGNMNQTQLNLLDGAALSGWLMSLVCMFSKYLVQGGATIIGSTVQSFAGMTNQIAGHTGTQLSTGNMSYGNTSMNNHSWNSDNANKHSLGYNQLSGLSTFTTPNGATETLYQDASHSYDASGILSKLPINLNSSAQQQRVLSQAQSDQEKVVETTRGARSTALSNTVAELQKYGRTHHSGTDNSSNWTEGTGGSQSSSYALMAQEVDDYAKTHRVSNSDAWRAYLNAMVGAKGGLIAYGGIEAGTTVSHDHTDSNDTTTGHRVANTADFKKNWDRFIKESHDDSKSIKHGDGRSHETGVSDSFTKLANANKSYDAAVAKENAIANTLSRSRTNGLGSNENLNNEFQGYLEDQVSSRGTQAYGGLSAQQILTGTNAEARNYRDQIAGQFLSTKFAAADGVARLDPVKEAELGMQSEQNLNRTGNAKVNDYFTTGAGFAYSAKASGDARVPTVNTYDPINGNLDFDVMKEIEKDFGDVDSHVDPAVYDSVKGKR